MTGKCELRSVDTKGYGYEWLREPYIPDACFLCINGVASALTTRVTVTSNYDAAVAEAREVMGEGFDPDDADKWNYTYMKIPGEGANRQVKNESGFDLLTHSDLSVVARTEDTSFVCPSD